MVHDSRCQIYSNHYVGNRLVIKICLTSTPRNVIKLT